MNKKFLPALIAFAWLLAACRPVPLPPAGTPVPTGTPLPASPTAALDFPSPTAPTPDPAIPDFSHIVIVIFENKEFDKVIGNPQMPVYNRLAREYTLLSSHYAVAHPSLPNYIALVSGDTFGIDSDCRDCFVNAPSLPDLIEQSGRTWKTYQEDMPAPCFLGNKGDYAQKHNPFVYFDPIRLDAARCERSVVPLAELDVDLEAGTLPDFIFISPNLCHDSHDCGLDVSDQWLDGLLKKLLPALDATGEPYLVALTFDEGNRSGSCCGLPEQAGGRVATVLLSPQARSGFQDETPYSHYSLLKTISAAWGLPTWAMPPTKPPR